MVRKHLLPNILFQLKILNEENQYNQNFNLIIKGTDQWIKKNCLRKVSYISRNNSAVKPYIRLQGEWLAEAGFDIGSLFIAEIENDKIILIKKPIN